MSKVRNLTDADVDALLEPEPPLWHRSLVTITACGLATAVFLWAAGHHPGGRLPHERLAVAECWDAIDRSRPMAETLHEMRVACQKMESLATAHENRIKRMAPTGQAIAMGE